MSRESDFQEWWKRNIRVLAPDDQLDRVASLIEDKIVATACHDRYPGYSNARFHLMLFVEDQKQLSADERGRLTYEFLYSGVASSGRSFCGRKLKTIYVLKDERRRQETVHVCMKCIKKLVLESSTLVQEGAEL